MPGPYHPGRRAPDVRGCQPETGPLRKPDRLRLALRTGRSSLGWLQGYASFVEKPGVRPYATQVTNRHATLGTLRYLLMRRSRAALSSRSAARCARLHPAMLMCSWL